MLEVRLKVLSIVLDEAEVITQGFDLSLLALVFRNRYYLLMQDSKDYEKIFTLGENFPLAGLRAPFMMLSSTQCIEQFLHLRSPLSFSELVANPKFWCSAIRLRAARRPALFILQFAQLAMLERVVMSGNRLKV